MEKQTLSFKQIIAIISAGLFSFCGVLIETATNITFPTLINEFHVSTSLVQWMTTGNLLVMGILIPISSYLKKRFPTKNLFVVAGILFSTGLIIDIFANDFTLLLLGRLIQGAGVGIALPMMYNIILEESPQHLLGLLMGIGSFVTAAAPAIGPMFGGVMTQYLTWRYIFICVLPVIIIACIMGYICIQNGPVDSSEKLDIIGYICIAIAFIALILGFSNLDQIFVTPVLIVGYFVVGIICLIAFGYRQIKSANPLIHFDIFHNQSFVFHTFAIMFLQMTTLGFGLLLPSYVQIVLQQSATKGGMVLLPGAIVGAVFAPVGGFILDKLGAKKPIGIGVTCCLISTLCFLGLFQHLTFELCVGLYFIYSVGIGLVVGNTMTCALSHLSQNLQADGNATLQTLMQLSGGIGTSMSATILSFAQQNHDLLVGTQTGAFYVFIFLVCSVVIVTISQIIAFKGGK